MTWLEDVTAPIKSEFIKKLKDISPETETDLLRYISHSNMKMKPGFSLCYEKLSEFEFEISIDWNVFVCRYNLVSKTVSEQGDA